MHILPHPWLVNPRSNSHPVAAMRRNWKHLPDYDLKSTVHRRLTRTKRRSCDRRQKPPWIWRFQKSQMRREIRCMWQNRKNSVRWRLTCRLHKRVCLPWIPDFACTTWSTILTSSGKSPLPVEAWECPQKPLRQWQHWYENEIPVLLSHPNQSPLVG